MLDTGDRSTERAQLKELLRLAEERIEHLMEENRSLNQFCNDLMDAQGAEAEQMAALMEQVIALEDALQSKASEQSEILALMASLNQRMTAMREQALAAMQAAAENRPRLQIVRQVFDIAAQPDADELDQRIAKYNAMIAQRDG